MAPNRVAISALIDAPSPPTTSSPPRQSSSLPHLAEAISGLTSPRQQHQRASIETPHSQDRPAYYASSHYYPVADSPRTAYAGAAAYDSVIQPSEYRYPAQHPPTYAHTPPIYPSTGYDRPYSRHSQQSGSSHSRSQSPELSTTLGVTGMKRKRSDEEVMVVERDRDIRGRYAYSDTRDTYEPAPPPPRLSPTRSLPPISSVMHDRSPELAYHRHERPETVYYGHMQSPNTPYRASPLAHTSTSGEYHQHQTYPVPAPRPYGYTPPPTHAQYPSPTERERERERERVQQHITRVSPHAEVHYPAYANPRTHTDPHHEAAYRSPPSSFDFAPTSASAPRSSHSHLSHHPQTQPQPQPPAHPQPPYESYESRSTRPSSSNSTNASALSGITRATLIPREPIIPTPYAVHRTETSPVVAMVQRKEAERRANGRAAWWGGDAEAVIREEPVSREGEGEKREPTPMQKEESQDEQPRTAVPPQEPEPRTDVLSDRTRDDVSYASDETRHAEQIIKPETVAVAAAEVASHVPLPAQDVPPSPPEPEIAQSALHIPPTESSKPHPEVDVKREPEPTADMDIDIVSESPAATLSVAHPTPIDGPMPAIERSPSLASTLPLAPELIEPSPAPTIARASTAPDADSSPAPTVLRVEPSPPPTILRDETKQEPASPILNVDVLSPTGVPGGIRQPSDAPLAEGNVVKVPESTQLASLVDAALHPAKESVLPSMELKEDMEVDVVAEVGETPDARGGSVISEATAEKAGVGKSKSASKSKGKSHKAGAGAASGATAKADAKSKSKAKDTSKAAAAKEKEATKAKAKDVSPTPAPSKSKKKSHHKQASKARSPEAAEDTPEPGKAGEEEEEKEKDDRLYCMCETLYDEDRFMIGCDRCDNWYHPACVGLEEEQADLIDKFFCPRCIAAEPNLNTTHKSPCARFPSCSNPARLPSSKYCSDECGQARVEEIYNMQPKSVQELIKKAVQGAKRPEGSVDPATGRVNGRGKGEEAQLEMLQSSLQQVLDDRAESEKRLEMWEMRERMVDAIVGRWKHEQKEEGICGYDARLGYSWDELDSVDPSEPTEVCQEGLKCDRHRGWQSVHQEGVVRAKALEEENLQDLTLRERGLRREMEVLEAKRKMVQKAWRKLPESVEVAVPVTALSEEAGLANEVLDIIDVKVEG